MKRFLFIILITIIFASCERESRLTSIDVVQSMDVYVGDHVVLMVSHTPSDAMLPVLRYKSSDPYVAAVDSEGTVVCNHVGTCTIRIATADTRFATTCTVNVKQASE